MLRGPDLPSSENPVEVRGLPGAQLQGTQGIHFQWMPLDTGTCGTHPARTIREEAKKSPSRTGVD
jgi:hypothetical protein